MNRKADPACNTTNKPAGRPAAYAVGLLLKKRCGNSRPLQGPGVSQIAEGFSLKAFEIKGPKDLGPVLEEAFSTKKPCFVMVDVLPEDRLISPVPRWIQPGRDIGLLCMY
jgi:hypothetical protein